MTSPQPIRVILDSQALRQLNLEHFSADRAFLEQTLANILDNAGKYSYPNSEVKVDVARTNVALEIRVRNTGVELRRSDIEHSKQRGWRGASAHDVAGEGSGLGLWIADRIMSAHDGQLKIQVNGHDTTVILSFAMPMLREAG